jgi:hypothetical protein
MNVADGPRALQSAPATALASKSATRLPHYNKKGVTPKLAPQGIE